MPFREENTGDYEQTIRNRDRCLVGLGLELATICAQEGFDLLIAADRPEIHTALRQIEIVLKGNVTESTQLRFKCTGRAA